MATTTNIFCAILLFVFTLGPHTTQSKPNVTPFGFLKSLEGSRKGQNVAGLHQLKSYLVKFGYLENNRVSENELTIKNDDGLFDEHLEKAIRTYQNNYRLNTTGHLDAATVKQMMKPRCGCADIINGRNTMQRKHNTSSKSMYGSSFYGVIGTRWTSSELTYQIRVETLIPGSENMRYVVADALNKWAEYSPFSFQEVGEGSRSNLVFGFAVGDHGDGFPFDGRGGVLGHSFPPPDGRSHYDANDIWSDNPGQYQIDLNSVVLHEIGHLLGLGHSADINAVMHSGINYGERRRVLQEDDIQGIQALYGS
ncbi:hypothetical protein SOVF_021490 [Spinacia oleracea]|nr:hypothetical protein SOVF_021490 [Spinacia oleracea]